MKYELLAEICRPSKTHETDAGMDLRSTQEVLLAPEYECKIPLGIKTAIPEGYCGLVVPRSGLGSQGLRLKNTIGVIDSDYRGEWMAFVKNESTNNSIKINIGDRICQVIIVPVYLGAWEEAQLTATERGDGGFGHTGTK
jgi:dUTP pyrophosphatase